MKTSRIIVGTLVLLLALLEVGLARAQVVGGVAGYNPYTGARGRAAAGYNPYTGNVAGGRSGYNPYTGTGARTRTAYNPYTGTAARATAAYNPYTGRYGYRVGVRR